MSLLLPSLARRHLHDATPARSSMTGRSAVASNARHVSPHPRVFYAMAVTQLAAELQVAQEAGR